MKHFFDNQQMLSFSEWLMVEAFEPVTTPYGTNPMYFSDKNITQTVANISGFDGYFTCIKLKDTWVLCYIKTQEETSEVGFMVSKDIIDNKTDIPSARFYDSVEEQSNALSVFNKVFYVLLKLIKESKSNKVFFEGSNKYLSSVYSGMVKNKNLQKVLNDMGYKFYQNVDKYYLENV